MGAEARKKKGFFLTKYNEVNDIKWYITTYFFDLNRPLFTLSIEFLFFIFLQDIIYTIQDIR